MSTDQPQKTDSALIGDITASARRVTNFIGDLEEAAFYEDEMTQDAVAHSLFRLGRAADAISDEFRKRHPEVNWLLTDGLGLPLVTHYDRVTPELLWEAATVRVPAFVAQLGPVIPAIDDGSHR